MNLIQEVRSFLKDNGIDYLLVNSTNEFLVEYSELQENARYFLTNFSGSTGDAVISQKDIFLFVDGRYHEQADLEVDKKFVTVVKMKLGESMYKHLLKKIKNGSTLAIVSKKNSQGRLEIIKSTLKDKNVEIKLLDSDPVLDEKEGKEKGERFSKIETGIAGLSSLEKIKQIVSNLNPNEAIFISNLEEVSYILNLRDFSKNYTSAIKGKYLITKSTLSHPELVSGSHHIAELDSSKAKFGMIKDEYDKIETIFVDKTTLTAYDYALLGDKAKSLKQNYIKEMKSVKTPEEIEHYKASFERTDKAILATREFIEQNENISEYDIAKTLEENFYKFGAKSLSFKSIVAKDQNSALAHYSLSSKTEVLTEGSLVLIDCGAYYEGGYATDCTRVFVKGTPSKLQKKVYTTVLKGFLKAFNKTITPTTSGFSLDKAARTVLEIHKPAGFEFSHSLGHGIGISVHESPPSLAFSPTAKTPLKVNMCFTIEPGLYKKSFGGVRLENSCYLTEENGKRVIKSFTNMCFEKKLIDFDLLTPTEKKQLKKFELC